MTTVLQLQTHTGNGVPLALYKDTACTIPATADGDVVAAWVDELSGSGLIATQATSTKRPILRFVSSTVGTVPVLEFDGVDDTLVVSSGFSWTPGSVYVTFMPEAGAVTTQILSMYNTNDFFFYASGGMSHFYIASGSMSNDSRIYNYWQRQALCNPSSGNLELRLAGVVDITGTITQGTTYTGPLYIASADFAGTAYFKGYVGAVIFSTTGPFNSTVDSGLASLGTFVDTAMTVINCDGDSQTAGNDSVGVAGPYPAQLQALLPLNVRVQNYGIASETLATVSGMPWPFTMASNAPAQIDATYPASATNKICAISGGTNDLFFGATASAVQNSLTTYWAARRAAGEKIIAHTILPRQDTGVPGGFEANRQTVNTWIRANPSLYDALADIAADSRLSDPTNTTYFGGDKVHPVNAGYAVWAGITYAAATPLLISISAAIADGSGGGTSNLERGEPGQTIGLSASGLTLTSNAGDYTLSNGGVVTGAVAAGGGATAVLLVTGPTSVGTCTITTQGVISNTLNVVDTTAPPTPTGLALSQTAATYTVHLSWTAESDTFGGGLTSYKITQNGTVVGTVAAPTAAYTLGNVSAGDVLGVEAVDPSGNTSSIETMTFTGPITPSAANVRNLTAVGYSTGTLVVPSAGSVLSGVTFDNGTEGTYAATYTSAANVRLGTDRGDGTLGTLAVPTASQVLNGVAVDATTGNVLLPDAQWVSVDGPSYGPNGDTSGTFNPSFPTATDVRLGVTYGNSSTHGTLAVPTASQVLNGVAVDATTGNVVLPSASSVVSGVDYGPSSGTAGTVALPAVDDVLVGTEYGAGGTQYTGTASGGGLTDSQAAVIAELGTMISDGAYTEAALAEAPSGGGGGSTGSGAYAVTATVNDGTDPIQGAYVRMAANGQGSFVGTSNSSGVVMFSLDAAAYTVSATASGYSFTPTTQPVAASSSFTISMTAVSLPAAPTIAQSTGYVDCYDGQGNLAANVEITCQVQSDTSGSDSTSPFTLSSNASGRASDFFKIGATYTGWRGDSQACVTFTVPDEASFELPAILGTP